MIKIWTFCVLRQLNKTVDLRRLLCCASVYIFCICFIDWYMAIADMLNDDQNEQQCEGQCQAMEETRRWKWHSANWNEQLVGGLHNDTSKEQSTDRGDVLK